MAPLYFGAVSRSTGIGVTDIEWLCAVLALVSSITRADVVYRLVVIRVDTIDTAAILKSYHITARPKITTDIITWVTELWVVGRSAVIAYLPAQITLATGVIVGVSCVVPDTMAMSIAEIWVNAVIAIWIVN
jgi:hypothetical protein